MESEKAYVFGTNRTRTICEVFRDINDQFQGDSEVDRQARDLVINGILLSKRLVKILAAFKRTPGSTIKWSGTINDWLFKGNTREHIDKAHTIRSNPDYKVGSKYN